MTINLTSQNRTSQATIPHGTKKITLTVSREKCSDVLLECVDLEGKAKGKPLNKYLPGFPTKGKIAQLRFIMNDFSVKPIEITLIFK